MVQLTLAGNGKARPLSPGQPGFGPLGEIQVAERMLREMTVPEVIVQGVGLW